ncbi:MAG TPA: adenylate/guanylate cyclase domain-containing protein [Pseudolabrys sp.]|nr:adenylate/guanylate cyclase domain-containing protein [Pseudolabrys sp.]
MLGPAHSHLAAQCGICGTLLSGAGSAVYRVFGIKRSPRNPNICTRCSTHVEEGRVVEITVLFADLSSFTELTQELGAEKTHQVVDSYLRMATDVLVKHGAFIDKYVGDAVMALFNVPIRQSDHARRAIVAATELEIGLKELGSRLDLPLQASVGIATGHARVGRLGSDDAKDYTAIGDAVNLAARLQGKAGAGEILIAQESYAKHAADFPEARAENFVLKGFREPVAAYRLHGRGGQLVSDPIESPARQQTSLGAIIFSLLGAPCAIATLIGPLAGALGVGGLFGLAGALTFLDQSVVRLPVLVLATLAALANLYTLQRARKLRLESTIAAHLKTMTALEKRRTAVVLGAAILTLAIVLFEIVAHALMH